MREQKRIPLLLISGPIGVGKTSVGFEVSEVLIEQEIPHTFVDLDQLRYTYPRPKDDRFGNRLGLQNLRDVWRNGAAAGAQNLVIASVIETQSDVKEIEKTIPNAETMVCQLRAKEETLSARVRKREIGSGLDWHLRRAAELAEILSGERVPNDFELWTDGREVRAIAQEIYDRTHWVLPSIFPIEK